jgi:gluconolactonase
VRMDIIAPAAFVALAAAVPAGAQDGNSGSPLEPGAKLERLPGTYSFTEGPCADAEGNVYFTDQPNDRIHRWGLDGKVTVFLEKAGRSNGMNFTPGGILVACADDLNELWAIDPRASDPRASRRIIAREFGGKPLNGPNDVYVMADGGMYLTDPLYERNYWKPGVERQDREEVYYLAPGASGLVRATSDLVKPNGIIGTPDGSTLYVADIGANETWRYRIMADRTLAGKTLFCSLGSDGMTIDAAGNLYLTGRGVTIFDKDGKKIGNVPVRENWTSNVSFGGADRKWLFITASLHVYRIRTSVAGAHAIGK